MFWVYMLECLDQSYYIGHTDDLGKRIAQHEQGSFPTCFTYCRRPVKLVYSQECPTREQALTLEKKIKGWSRAKKSALIHDDWTEISRLARNRQQ